MQNKYKLAIVASHPIQYQAPLFRALAEDPRLDVTVYYLWDFGVNKPGFDRELGVDLKWDVPLLDGYTHVFLKNHSLMPGPSFFGQINPSVVRELKKNKFDAVIVHGYTSMTSWLVFLTRAYTGVKIILRGETNLSGKSGFLKNVFKSLVLRSLFGTIQVFLYSYALNRDFYLHYGVPDKKLFFFPCAVDNNFFGSKFKELKDKKLEIRRSLGIKAIEASTFIFVGKLMKRKRPFDILKAVASLDNKIELNLLFVGDGEDKGALEEYVKENDIKNIHFFGFKNQSELPDYYVASDVLVLSSEFDPSPKQLNEAMNFGLALIVSSGVGTAPDLVKESGSGLIYKTGDVDALARCMEKFATDPALLERIKANSLKTVEAWSFEKDVEGALRALEWLEKNNERGIL